MPRKPTVRKGPASNYSAPRETIVEFSDGRSGGLISIRRIDEDGPLVVEVYRADADVRVLSESEDYGTNGPPGNFHPQDKRRAQALELLAEYEEAKQGDDGQAFDDAAHELAAFIKVLFVI